ncbi:MAG: IS66 family insertion sequence element accessory protein TnpB [Oligoflexia bacterium]|nr:IS66 family insertion sequence element accessory protein TnpB [Oligoflexia bacterium]
MRALDNFSEIYLYRHFVDFRKAVNGLGAIVQEEMKLDLFSSSALFVFCCKRKKRIKILYLDKTGFAYWYKKLENDLFFWPKKNEDKNENEITSLNPQELQWLLDGINLTAIKPHSKKNYQKIC